MPYGKYYCKEKDTGSKYYLLNTNTYNFEIKTNEELIEKTIDNEPVEIKVNIDKKGTIETRPNEIVNYTFSNIVNESNVQLEDFKWCDYIPTDSVRLETMTTGVYNQRVVYNVYYKTNKSDSYIPFKENLSTITNYELDFTEIELDAGEYITETCFDFGKVDIGFKATTEPTMNCRTLYNVRDGKTFTNITKIVGIFGEIYAEKSSTWNTIIHVPDKPQNVLPNTGK